jgi:hypothetical protein
LFEAADIGDVTIVSFHWLTQSRGKDISVESFDKTLTSETMFVHR